MSTPAACPDKRRLQQMLTNRLPKQEQAALADHLGHCPRCQRRLDELAAGDRSWDALRRLAQRQAAPLDPALRKAVEELADQSAAPASAPDREEPADLDFLEPPREPGNLGRLGHYEILQVVGRGGMGIVLKAFDEKLHRVVAVKVLAPHLASSAAARQRFVREARAAAAVAHEHVIAIHAVEDAGPLPYLVTQYVSGGSLQERLDGGAAFDVKEVTRIAMQIAAGLAAAHRQGLVHRDVKPANVLLENGIQRVKITDFGLARTSDDASITQSGVIAGTPLFMAPEQARGEAVDHRADLFSLGSLLYVLCTGRPPFRARTTLAVLQRVSEANPRPVQELNPDVPDWLAAVIAKLHAKAPAGRYQTAQEVADLLARRLARLQQPARPAPAEPARRSVLLVLAGAAAALALGAAAFATYALLRPALDPDAGKVAAPPPLVPRPGMTAAELAALPSPLDALRRADVSAGWLARAGRGNPNAAPAELVAVLGDDRLLLPEPGTTAWPDQTADGKLLAVPAGKSVALFDAGTGERRGLLRGHDGALFRVRFSPDGRHLAASTWGPEYTIAVWDVRAGKVVQTLKGHTATVVQLSWSPDGKRLASASDDGTARVWDPFTGAQKLLLRGHDGQLWNVLYSPDGSRLVTVGRDGWVRLREAETGDELKAAQAHPEGANAAAFSRDGTLLAIGNDHEAQLYDARALRRIARLDRPAGWLAFAPDGKTLYTARHDHLRGTTHTVYRWNLRGVPAPLPELPLLGQGAFALYHLSPDGATLYAMRSRPPDPRLSAYDAHTGRPRGRPRGHHGPALAVAVHPDGHTLASGGVDRRVLLWDAVKGGTPRVLERHTGSVRSLAFSPNGRLLASGSEDGTIVLWDAVTAAPIRTLTGHARSLARIAFSPDGHTLAAGGLGEVRFWNVETGEAAAALRVGRGPLLDVAWSPDGTRIASAGYDGIVFVHEVATGKEIHAFKTRQTTNAVAFSADGTLLAAACDRKDCLYAWNLTTGRAEKRHGEENGMATLALHPAGTLAAAAGRDGTVHLWDLTPGSTKEHVIGPGPFGLSAVHVAMTPEGRYLVTANADGSLCILRLAALGQIPAADPPAAR